MRRRIASFFKSGDGSRSTSLVTEPVTDLRAALFEAAQRSGLVYKMSLAQAMRNFLILGSIGSGKTSGSGDELATCFLECGFGGIVMTGKKGEAEAWKKRMKRAGRKEEDIIHFRPGSKYRFNPFAYEMKRTDPGGRNTETLKNLFMSIVRLGNRLNGGGQGKGGDMFWTVAPERMIKASLDLLKLSGQAVSIDSMVKLIANAPKNMELSYSYSDYKTDPQAFEKAYSIYRAYRDKHPGSNRKELVAQMIKDGYPHFTPPPIDWETNLIINSLRVIELKPLNSEDKNAFEVAKQYFLLDVPTMGERLRGSLVETVYAYANSLRTGTLATYFGEGLDEDIFPEQTFEGKVIILDFSYQEFGVLGSYAQTLYKRTWQAAVQRREIDKNTRPVFLWADEYQVFADPDDQEFCAIGRESRVISVFLTQNISNLYKAIGNRDTVISMMGNMVNKVFHQNGDYNTNEFAVRTIAKSRVLDSRGDLRYAGNLDLSYSDKDPILASVFTTLKSGGDDHDYIVDAVLTGDIYGDKNSKKNYLICSFEQYFADEARKARKTKA